MADPSEPKPPFPRNECEEYLNALYALTRGDVTFDFSEEELRDLEANGVSLAQIIAELENANEN